MVRGAMNELSLVGAGTEEDKYKKILKHFAA